MKAVFVLTQDYFKRVNTTAVFVSVLGEKIAHDDILYDVATKNQLKGISDLVFSHPKGEAGWDFHDWAHAKNMSFEGNNS